MTPVLHRKIPFIRNFCIHKQIHFALKIVAHNKTLHILTAARSKAISTLNIALHLIKEMCKEINFMTVNINLCHVKVLM